VNDYLTTEQAIAQGFHIDATLDDIDFTEPDGSAEHPYPTA
jgi:hypothetical protein